MKRIIAILLLIGMLSTLSACVAMPGIQNNGPASTTQAPGATQRPTKAPSVTTKPTQASDPTDIWAGYEAITVAQALRLCENHVSAPSNEWYYIIATIDSVDDYTYGQLTISDETGSIMVYGSYNADGSVRYAQMARQPVPGDTVLFYGRLQNYNGTIKEVQKAYIIDYISNGGSTQQPPAVQKLTYISDRRVQYNEADEQYVVFFGLQDQNNNYMDGSGTAEITIKDSNNNVLYSQSLRFAPSDFTEWTNTTWDSSRYLCGLYIDREDIAGSTSTSGTLSIKVTMDDGVYFDWKNCSIYDLPEKSMTILLPELPTEVADSSYSYVSILTIKEITYTSSISYDGSANVTFTFLVTLTEKSSKENESASTKIGYKLYDSDGVVVDSGTIYVTPLAEGETARENEYIYNLDPNETYTLKLMNAK